MSTATVPMFSPDGQSGDIPVAKVNDALSAGFKRAVAMTSPDGRLGYIPQERAGEAVKAGFKVGQPAAQEAPPEKGDPVLNDLGTLAKGTLASTYQVSAPGVAASLLAQHSPAAATFMQQHLPSWAQPAKAEDLPGQIVTTAAPMMLGADELPRNSVEPAPKPVAGAAEGLAGDLAGRIIRRLPYIGKVVKMADLAGDILDAIKGPAPEAPAAPTPKPPATFQPGPQEMWGKAVEAPTSAPAVAPPTSGPSTVPRTLSGEGVLNQALTGLDNKTLLKVARSRGVNVTAEAQLKPGIADNRIIQKVIDDFSPDELDDVRNTGLEVSRFQGSNNFADPKIAAEAWHNKVLQTYFPDVSIPQASLNRVRAAQAAQAGSGQDLTGLLQESIKQARAKKAMVPLSALVR